MADILISSSDLAKAIGLPEDVVIYSCVREEVDLFRFKISGPLNIDGKDGNE